MKTLAEIAIEAGLVDKASAAKAGRMAEERKQPLVVVLVRDLKVDELALVSALRKHTRVPLLDPGSIRVDPDAAREVPSAVCERLRVQPVAVMADGGVRVLRVAMADPTDTRAIAELESLTKCEIDVSALPLSAIDELIARGTRPPAPAAKPVRPIVIPESEISVTAQIPLSAIRPDDEDRLESLIRVLVAKGLVTEAELAEALRKPRG